VRAPRHKLRGAIAQLGELDVRIGPAFAAIDAAVDDIDGFGSGRSFDGPKGSTDVRTSPVERAVGKIVPHTRSADRLNVIVTTLVNLATEALLICASYAPEVDAGSFTCIAGPHEDWWRREWGLGCDNIVPPERRARGYCDRCRKRRDRAA
jgi:hypothetical protein